VGAMPVMHMLSQHVPSGFAAWFSKAPLALWCHLWIPARQLPVDQKLSYAQHLDWVKGQRQAMSDLSPLPLHVGLCIPSPQQTALRWAA
jgi:hypothetical protein